VADTSDRRFLIETQDGGDNWTVQIDDLPLNAIHFKDGFGWAVGDNGLLLRCDGTTWIDQNTGQIYPNKFTLRQNYPNPFNPVTSIKYQVARTSQVDLSIFNILGQKVATLVSDKQQAGDYNVEWDASGFASGVYLYRLTADKFIEIKKLVFIK